jgi:hypothetical protein
MLAELERFLADADPGKAETQVAVGALVAVGTPEMQQALARLVEARAHDDKFAQLAIPTMAFLATPTVATETAIRSFTRADRSETMQSTSHLALGIMATQLSKGETARAAAIVDEYAQRLAGARTTEDRRRWMQVLGNARTEASAAAIATQLAEPDPRVRSRAVDALRLAPSPDVDRTLAHALADEDAGVRESAARSLSYRKPDAATLEAMLGRLAGEADPKVAATLLETVWMRRAPGGDRVIAAVERIARAHASPAVRERAQRLLHGGAS